MCAAVGFSAGYMAADSYATLFGAMLGSTGAVAVTAILKAGRIAGVWVSLQAQLCYVCVPSFWRFAGVDKTSNALCCLYQPCT
jgi:hypothetical protein